MFTNMFRMSSTYRDRNIASNSLLLAHAMASSRLTKPLLLAELSSRLSTAMACSLLPYMKDQLMIKVASLDTCLH